MTRFFQVLLLSLSFLFAGCLGSLNEEDLSRITHAADEECSGFRFSQGEKAAFENFYSERVETTHFGKQIDMDDFEALFLASAESTIDFLKMYNVPVYRAPSDGCQFFQRLEVFPPADLDTWNARDAMAKSRGGFLGGIYMASEGGRRGAIDIINPRVGMRTSADRWTLVHETAHFLFNHRRVAIGETIFSERENLRNALDAVDRAQREYQKEKVSSRLTQIAIAYEDLFRAKKVELRSGPLEEVTIESLIGDALVKGKIKYMKNQLRSAHWYAKMTGEDAKSELSQISGNVSKFKKEAITENWDVYRKFENVESMVNGLVAEIDQLVFDAERRKNAFPLERSQFDLMQPFQLDRVEGRLLHLDCAHRKEMDPDLKKRWDDVLGTPEI